MAWETIKNNDGEDVLAQRAIAPSSEEIFIWDNLSDRQSNFLFQCEIWMNEEGDINTPPGILFRFEDVQLNSKGYFLAINVAADKVQLYKRTGDNTYNLINETSQIIDINKRYSLCITAYASKIIVWFDGSIVLDVTDNTHLLPGFFGLRGKRALEIDNILISELRSPIMPLILSRDFSNIPAKFYIPNSGNLVVNGGFEDSSLGKKYVEIFDGWEPSYNSSVEVVDAGMKSGSRAVKCSQVNSDAEIFKQAKLNLIDIKQSRSYILEADIKTIGGGTTVGINLYSNDNIFVTTLNLETIDSGGRWYHTKKLIKSSEFTSGLEKIGIVLKSPTTNLATEVIVDNFSIYEAIPVIISRNKEIISADITTNGLGIIKQLLNNTKKTINLAIALTSIETKFTKNIGVIIGGQISPFFTKNINISKMFNFGLNIEKILNPTIKLSEYIKTYTITERISDYSHNANILTDNSVSDSVRKDEDFCAAKFPDNNNTFDSIRIFFDVNHGVPTDDLLFFRYKIPFKNYCTKSDGTIIGQFSNGSDGWTVGGNGVSILSAGAGNYYLSNNSLQCLSRITDGNIDGTSKMTDTFTTPSDLTNAKLKLRVKRTTTTMGNVGDTKLSAEILDTNDVVVQTHKILERIGASTNVDLGGSTMSESAAEVTFNINTLNASTQYRLQIHFIKTGVGNTDAITRQVDYIRIEFPAGETSIINDEEDEYSTFHNYITLDVRTSSTEGSGGSFVNRYYNIKDIHDSSVTGAGLANTTFSDNNVWDEGWAGSLNNITGWTHTTISGIGTSTIIQSDLELHAAYGGDTPQAGELTLQKDVGHFTQHGITGEFNYKITNEVNPNKSEIIFYSGIKKLTIKLTTSAVSYVNTVGSYITFASSSNTLNTEYVLRFIWIANSNKLIIWRRQANSSSWTKLGSTTLAGEADAVTTSGTIKFNLSSGDVSGDSVKWVSKYLSVSRGRIPPLLNNELPSWSDIKRAFISPYYQIVTTDDATTFSIDTMGIEVTTTIL